MKKILTLLAIALAALTSCKPDEETISPSEVYLNVYYDDIVFPSDGGEDSFEIESNGDWVITNDADWLTIEPSEGKGSCSITLTASASDLYDDRNTVITVKAGDKTETFTVTQKYAEALLVTKNKFDIPQEGGEFTVEVQSNISYDIVIDEGCQSWITEVPSSKALSTYTHTFSVESNPNTTKRDGSIEVIGSNGKTETVNIYQAQKDELVLSKLEETVPAKGGEVRVQLRSNVDYEVIIPEDIEWVELIQSDKADELVFNVKPNDKTEEREVGITVKDKNSDLSQIFTIKQIVGSIILEESYFEVDAKGGSIEVTLSTDIDFEVIIPENIDWVKTIETKSLTDSTFYLSVLPNSLTEEREAEITVKDVNSDVSQTLTIKQKVGQIIIEQTEFEVQFKGGIISIPYSSDIECEVIIPESTQAWINVIETKSMNTDTVELSIALNEMNTERTATITIQDINSALSQGVKITQMAFGYYKGDIEATSEEDLKEICDAGYTVIDGNAYFNVKSLSLLGNTIEEIKGDLRLGADVTSLDGLYGLKHIGGDLLYNFESTYGNAPLQSYEGLNNLKRIGGNFEFNGATLPTLRKSLSLQSLENLETIEGDLKVSNVSDFEGSDYLTNIGGMLSISYLNSCKGLSNIKTLNSFSVANVDMSSFEGFLTNLTTINGGFFVYNSNIKNFQGLNNLKKIGGSFVLEDERDCLSSFQGLNNLQEIGGNFVMSGGGLNKENYYSEFNELESFKGLESLTRINGDFIIQVEFASMGSGGIFNKLSSFEGLSNLRIIGGDFKIRVDRGKESSVFRVLESLHGLDNLVEIGGNFDIECWGYYSPTCLPALTFSEGPQKLSVVGGDFIIHGNFAYKDISSMEGFSGLEKVNGKIEITNIKSFYGLNNLNIINGDFIITSGDTQGMSNLATIGGSLTVSGESSSINGLTGLNSINGNLSISETSMTAITGPTQLQKVGGDIEISDNSELDDISGFSGLANCANVSITNSPNLYNFQPLETTAKNMTGTWYVYGCGYNPTKYQMLNGESKPQE